MIHFKSCEWKNFLSTGNDPIRIQLNKSPTTLIVGQNGAGTYKLQLRFPFIRIQAR